MSDYVFSDWKKSLEDFQNCVEKDLEEVRKEKAEVQRLKAEIFNLVESGHYVRDDHKIIVSAPEIVIGNVDKDGTLKPDGFSKVTIRANSVNIEGTGGTDVGGEIVSRAASIRNIAVDPGSDGEENVVCGRSEIISQAKGIVLNSYDEEGCFHNIAGCGGSGIKIASDSVVAIKATKGNESLKKSIDNSKSNLNTQKSNLKQEVSNAKKSLTDLIDKLEEIMTERDKLTEDDISVRLNIEEIIEKHRSFEHELPALYATMNTYIRAVAKLAEANRQISELDKQSQEADNAKGDFKTKSTETMVYIAGETITNISADGDGNLRDNDEAGFSVQAKHTSFAAYDAKSALMPKGTFNVGAESINLSTSNSNVKDDKNIEYKADGSVNIVTKQMNIEGVDYDIKNDELEENDITKDGQLNIRIESIDIKSTDKEGKATGAIKLNAKEIEIKAKDTDKENKSDKELAKEGKITITAEKMYEGEEKSLRIEKQAKWTGLIGEEVGIFAKKTAEIQQEGALVQLDGGNLTEGGSAVKICGDTTIGGKADIKGDVTAPKITGKNIEASSSFKSTNISDGIAVPAPAAPEKANAKLKEKE
ncbi:MAG: hypothetical protein MJZ93_02365 [Paludibacteraceae bacterium]|nr:hypothetical protein [Paludibacteraceae bacterium]